MGPPGDAGTKAAVDQARSGVTVGSGSTLLGNQAEGQSLWRTEFIMLATARA